MQKRITSLGLMSTHQSGKRQCKKREWEQVGMFYALVRILKNEKNNPSSMCKDHPVHNCSLYEKQSSMETSSEELLFGAVGEGTHSQSMPLLQD